MRNRGLLTEDDRAYWRGDKDVDSDAEPALKNEKRHNVKERIENIVHDLELLADTDDDDLVDLFHSETDRDAKLEAELADIRKELRNATDSDDGEP